MNTVIFDFDGTLTKIDTLRPFAHFLATENHAYLRLSLFYLSLIFYRLKLINDNQLKTMFLKLFVKGLSKKEAGQLAKKFYEQQSVKLLNQNICDKLHEHLSCGDKVYLVSANFDFFLIHFIDEWKLSGLLCTETATDGYFLTGEIIGQTCKGINKIIKLISVFGEDQLRTFIAYGDQDDVALLKIVNKGVKIS